MFLQVRLINNDIVTNNINFVLLCRKYVHLLPLLRVNFALFVTFARNRSFFPIFATEPLGGSIAEEV